MILKTLVVGPFAVNCYLLSCQKTGEAIIIDPGDEGERISEMIEAENLSPKYVLLTHAHIDHVLGVPDLQRRFDVRTLMHREDSFLIKNLLAQAVSFGLSIKGTPRIDGYVEEGDVITFGTRSLQVIHTPGHTPGGISLLGKGRVFVGDTLFAGSVGRTDLPGGSYRTLIQSIKSKLFSLDDKVMVYPGHGPTTTIKEERLHNPFLKGVI